MKRPHFCKWHVLLKPFASIIGEHNYTLEALFVNGFYHRQGTTGQNVRAPGFAFENMDFPIVGSKIKVAVESSVTYLKLSVDKYKTNEKR